MQVCAKRHVLMTTGRLFPSKSSDKVYKVTAYRSGEFPFCSCPAYIFQRSKIAKAEGVDQRTIPGSCKHLEQSLREACDWIQQSDGDYRFDDICPSCGSELVELGASEVPNDEASAVDDLRALLAEMNGEEAPAPVLVARDFLVPVAVTVHLQPRVQGIDPAAAWVTAKEQIEAAIADGSWVDLIATVENLRAGGDPIDMTEVKANAEARKAEPAAKRTSKPKATKRAGRNVAADVTALVQGARK